MNSIRPSRERRPVVEKLEGRWLLSAVGFEMAERRVSPRESGLRPAFAAQRQDSSTGGA